MTNKELQSLSKSARTFPFDHDHQTDDPIPPFRDDSHRAALMVLANLCDRRGIKHELEGCDMDVKREIVQTLAEIIEYATGGERA